MKFNQQQLLAIETRNQAIVAAGAGAGKTSVLVERYASLLELDGVQIDEILCLTFTRKAAGEMYERIYREVEARTSRSPGVARALERFSAAHITTIDAFCSSLIAGSLGAYGLPTNYRMADETFSRELRDMSFAFLDSRRSDASLHRIFEICDADTLVEDLFIPLAEVHVSHCSQSQLSPQLLYSTLGDMLAGELPQLLEDIAQVEQLGSEALSSKPKPKAHHAQIMMRLPQLLSAAEQSLEALQLLISSNPWDEQWTGGASGENAHAQGEQSAAVQTFGNALHDVCALHEQLSGLKLLKDWKTVLGHLLSSVETLFVPALTIFCEQNFYSNFYALVNEYLVNLLDFKRTTGVLYFRDLLEIATDILMNNPELADSYRRQIRYIMIDEFQDNNVLQKNMLYLLAAEPGYRHARIPGDDELRPGVLYFVGDEKQSIYRFRGADVSVFRAMVSSLPSGAELLPLDSNYRSSPRLISFFNSFFPRVMDAEQEWEAAYRALEPGIRQDIYPNEPEVELLVVAAPSSDADEHLLNSSESEAWAVARRIREMVERDVEQIFDRNSGELRPLRYSDIGVVFDKSSLQSELELMFRRLSIPYVSDSTRTLFLDGPANDVYNFFQLCAYPDDRYSLAALLRSPVFRIEDRSILQLMVHEPEDISSWVQEGQLPTDVSAGPEEQRLFTRFSSLLSDIRARLPYESRTDVLHRFWVESGYHQYMMEQAFRRKFIRYYDYLLEFFDANGELPLHDFLELLKSKLGQAKRSDDLQILHGQEDAVQLMTVHKSKGLEFPVLFLSHANSQASRNRDAVALWTKNHRGELFLYAGAPEHILSNLPGGTRQWMKNFRNPLVTQVKTREQAMENAELRRQLYVACTRAEQRLIISASGIKPSAKKVVASTTRPAEERGENFFDLLETGLQIDRTEVVSMEPDASKLIECGQARVLIRRCPLASQTEIRTEAQRKLPSVSRRTSADDAEALHVQGYSLLSPRQFSQLGRRSFTVSEVLAYISAVDWEGAQKSTLPEERSSSGSNQPSSAEQGTLVHYLIEQGIRAFQSGRGLHLPALEHIPGHIIPATLEAEHINRAWEMAANFIARELEPLIEFDPQMESEVAFDLSVGNFIIRGQIDLLVEISGRGTYVIDFKSGIDVDPKQYQFQLDCYRLAAMKLGYENISTSVADVRKGERITLAQHYSEQSIQEICVQLATEDVGFQGVTK